MRAPETAAPVSSTTLPRYYDLRMDGKAGEGEYTAIANGLDKYFT